MRRATHNLGRKRGETAQMQVKCGKWTRESEGKANLEKKSSVAAYLPKRISGYGRERVISGKTVPKFREKVKVKGAEIGRSWFD